MFAYVIKAYQELFKNKNIFAKMLHKKVLQYL